MAKSSTSWAPGQSGNAKGKPKKLPELRAKIEGEGLEAAYKAVLAVVKDKSAEPQVRVAASKVMFEWGLPKPQPTVSDGEIEKLEMICAALFDDSEDDADEAG